MFYHQFQYQLSLFTQWLPSPSYLSSEEVLLASFVLTICLSLRTQAQFSEQTICPLERWLCDIKPQGKTNITSLWILNQPASTTVCVSVCVLHSFSPDLVRTTGLASYNYPQHSLGTDLTWSNNDVTNSSKRKKSLVSVLLLISSCLLE